MQYLHELGDVKTVELVIDQLWAFEMQHHGDNLSDVVQCLKNGIKHSDLLSWVYSLTPDERQTIYTLKKSIQGILANTRLAKTSFQAKLGWCLDMMNGLLFFRGLFLELIFITVLVHISTNILAGEFARIGGINLNWTAVYLGLSILFSQACIYFFSHKKLRAYCSQYWPDNNFIKVCAYVFPATFVFTENAILKYSLLKLRIEMKKSVKSMDGQCQDEATLGNIRSCRKILADMTEERDRYQELHKILVNIKLWDNVTQNLPQAVVMVNFILASIKYPETMDSWLNDNLFQDYSEVGKWLAKVFFGLTTLHSLLNPITDGVNCDMFPSTVGTFGVLMQKLVISSLLFPKVFLAACSLMQAPYLFPIPFLLEYLAIIVYTKVVTRSAWSFFHRNTITSLCSPAFYRPKGTSESSWRQFKHSLALHVISGLIYFGCALICKHVVFTAKVYERSEMTDSTSSKETIFAYFWYVLCIYCGCTVLYGAFMLLYYKFGHPFGVFYKHSSNLKAETKVPINEEFDSDLEQQSDIKKNSFQ